MDMFDNLFPCIDLNVDGAKRKYKQRAKFRNLASWYMWFSVLVKQALARYSFDGLPDTVSERVLKFSLLYYASVCFFDQEGQLMALPGGAGTNGVTVYGDYTHCYVYSRNGLINKEVKLWLPGEEDLPLLGKGYAGAADTKPTGVWIRENEQKYPFILTCIQFADALADSWQKIAVARRNAAAPFIVMAEDREIASVKDALEKRDENQDVIVINKGSFAGDRDRVTVTPIGQAVEALKAHTDLIEWYLNEFSSLCGRKSNSNPDKTSGMPVVEVTSNDEAAKANLDDTVAYLQEGIDEVNKHFGTQIKVINNMEVSDNAVSRLGDNAGQEQVRDD